MKRRTLLMATAAGAALWWFKPGDEGAPYDEYFHALNQELKKNGPHRCWTWTVSTTTSAC